MTTIAEFANELKQRAAGWRARSHTIFNGAIIAEELQGWADKAAALSPPESTEEQVEAAAQRIYQAHIDHHGLHDLPSWSQLSEDDRAVYRRDASAALRVMPLQDHAATPEQVVTLDKIEQTSLGLLRVVRGANSDVIKTVMDAQQLILDYGRTFPLRPGAMVAEECEVKS